MHPTRTSLGSLAALASLVAVHEAEAFVSTSAITNVALVAGNSVSLDLDGDTTGDISIYVGVGSDWADAYVATGGVLVADFDNIRIRALDAGATIDSVSTFFNSGGVFDSFINSGTHFLGIAFGIGGNTHYGYLEMDFPTSSYADGVVVSAAWETVADTGITIAVPEPSTVGLVIGLAGSVLALGLRRRHR